MEIHNNNFDLIRILAASQVLLVHQFNSFKVNMGDLTFVTLFPGVPIFFFISGYLVAISYERSVQSGGIVDYASKGFL
jgi:peptidoglycan/LPS O-acetylase OafA/YrhL